MRTNNTTPAAGEIKPLTHSDLCEISYQWVLKRCGFAFKELKSMSWECPDVIGFRHGESILIECKVSSSDFFADRNKPFRTNPQLGMGNYRIYCCPEGLIKPEQLPEKWGLIYVSQQRKAKFVKNCFNDKGGNMFLMGNRFVANINEERSMMYTALRRLHIRNRIDEIYAETLTTPASR